MKARDGRTMRIGVLGLQGAFTEHRDAFARALEAEDQDGEIVVVRRPDELAQVDGLAMPGGESTTISKLLRAFDLHESVVKRAKEEDFPILGTCAGLILLAKEGDAQVEGTETRLLGLMDMAVNRNAFGRQRESFEASLALKGFDEEVPAVFIRAPAIVRTWGACEALGVFELPEGQEIPGIGRRPIVAAREGNRLALAFHPELTDDVRVHRHFVRMVRAWR